MKISDIFKIEMLPDEIETVRKFCKMNKLKMLIEEDYTKSDRTLYSVYILARNIRYYIPEEISNNYIIQKFIKEMNLVNSINNYYVMQRNDENYISMSILSNIDMETIKENIQDKETLMSKQEDERKRKEEKSSKETTNKHGKRGRKKKDTDTETIKDDTNIEDEIESKPKKKRGRKKKGTDTETIKEQKPDDVKTESKKKQGRKKKKQ